MNNLSTSLAKLPPEQQAIRDKCFHPSGFFEEFKKEEIEQSIPERFEKIAAKYPDRIAVKAGNHALTYDEVNKAANRVARAISAQRGEGEGPIALLLEHGGPIIIAILGVLKTGKIYVPLDPSLPGSRATYILENSQAGLIVTNNQHLDLAQTLAQHGSEALNIDMIDAGVSDENLGLSLSPDNLAYILYTSGSTGQPKGVVQNHRNVLHNMMKYINGSHICADDCLSLFFSCSFSAAVTNIFGALLNGAALFPFDIKREGLANLAGWLMREEITVYHSVPTVFRHFTDTLTGKEGFPRLRLIELTGEPVTKSDVELYKKHFSQDCILHNRMAATEMSLIRQYFTDKKTPITGSIVPVGFAVEDTEVLLLDDAGEEVGVDRIGEMAIKSHYLVPGYWRQPELTRTAFRPDPAGSSARIYCTGDLGRMRPDGCLEHLGRKDFQVKVRGHRIDIGEVELALLGRAAIKEAVVLAREDVRGNTELVAYIVSNEESRPIISELRSFLKERLPDYVIPSAFVFLEALPLTPNGKVDRRALPAPNWTRPGLETPFVSPRTPIEEDLARIWAEILGVERVGIHDNFLDLGGHSLMATQIISRIVNEFQVELPLPSLLGAPTVAEMARIITQERAQKVGPDELTRVLSEVESLSEEQTEQRLAEEIGLSNDDRSRR